MKVMVISPHPDDDLISMGGTIIRLCEQGNEVHTVYETSGAHWRVMAVSEGQATAAGTLADFCDATHTCSLGTCTSNVCTE